MLPDLSGRRAAVEGGEERSESYVLFTFVLVPQPALTTSTYVVAWPQDDRFLSGDL